MGRRLPDAGSAAVCKLDFFGFAFQGFTAVLRAEWGGGCWTRAAPPCASWTSLGLRFRVLPRCCVQVGRQLVDAGGAVVRQLAVDPGWEAPDQDPDHTALLCAETVDAGKSVLMFCASKKAREPLQLGSTDTSLRRVFQSAPLRAAGPVGRWCCPVAKMLRMQVLPRPALHGG